MGRTLGMSTLAVFLALVFWRWLWGPVGMFLSVPLTMMFKIGMENSRDLQWVAILLDSPAVAAARLRDAPEKGGDASADWPVLDPASARGVRPPRAPRRSRP